MLQSLRLSIVPLLLCLLASSSVQSVDQENRDPAPRLSLMESIGQLLTMDHLSINQLQLLSQGRSLETEDLPVYLQPFAYWVSMFTGLFGFGFVIPIVYLIFMLKFLISIFITTPIASLWGIVAGF